MYLYWFSKVRRCGNVRIYEKKKALDMYRVKRVYPGLLSCRKLRNYMVVSSLSLCGTALRRCKATRDSAPVTVSIGGAKEGSHCVVAAWSVIDG